MSSMRCLISSQKVPFPKVVNASFIALIPKMQDAKVAKDYRPISLISSLYKIIAKILANRLVVVLGDLVSEVQSAFIANRQILEGLILVNGSPTSEFHFRRGLKQVGGTMYQIKSWDEIVDKLQSRLSKWKMKTLSIGGRLTLLKSMLGSTPIYYMSMFKVPSKVLKCLEDIRRQFFNGADPKEKKMSQVKWSRVLASKDKGGLDVSSFFALNRALLLKRVWRFRNDRNSLWTRFIRALYGNSGSIEMPSIVSYPSIKDFVLLKINHNALGISVERQEMEWRWSSLEI
ncbi:RNA-directed DNA polymerase, eukaryota, reverse transcriptase zinc-binding domain protein [Tanacetum coccineum]